MRGGDAEIELATAISELARELTRTVPAPRAAPYFLLDCNTPYDPAVLDSLSSPGIFRKYEFVLLIRSGLGGTARWLARRLGCRVFGINPSTARTRAASILNDRARMKEEVSFAAAANVHLPFRDRVFTHVWMIDPAAEARTVEILAETFRVLRSGAHFALQTVDAVPAVETIREQLSGVGFVDITTRRAILTPTNQTANLARTRLQALLAHDAEAADMWCASVLTHPSNCTQIFGRRP